jgi:hypothetical protein
MIRSRELLFLVIFVDTFPYKLYAGRYNDEHPMHNFICFQAMAKGNSSDKINDTVATTLKLYHGMIEQWGGAPF